MSKPQPLAKRPPIICGFGTSPINPDSDIAGLGVILSFVTIGCLIMSLVCFKIYLDYREEFKFSHFFFPPARPLKTKGGGAWPGLEDARRLLEESQPTEDKEKAVEEDAGATALQSTFFSMADTQFATGLAICVGALTKSDITLYHYLVCNELAWLALISSTAGFLTARTVLDKANTAKKACRILVMWCLFALVATIEIRRNDDIGYAEEVYAAGPYWDTKDPGAQMSIALFVVSFWALVIDTLSLRAEMGILIYYYAETSVLAMSLPWTTAVKPFVTRSCARCAEQTTLLGTITHLMLHLGMLCFFLFIWLPIWLLGLLVYWFAFQHITAHLASCIFFIWGITSTFKWRHVGRRCMKHDEGTAEDRFGFGQVVAMTLLISPFIANADAWYDVMKAWLKTRRTHRVPTLDVSTNNSTSNLTESH